MPAVWPYLLSFCALEYPPSFAVVLLLGFESAVVVVVSVAMAVVVAVMILVYVVVLLAVCVLRLRWCCCEWLLLAP